MVQENKRQTARRVWLSFLDEGKFIKSEGEWEPNYLEVKGTKISRLNVIGTVVETFYNEEKLYASITLDDGTSTIRLKSWKEDSSMLKDFKKGDTILVIGKLREYQDEVYITPEIVKILNDPNWELLRKVELLKTQGKPKIMEIPNNVEIRRSPEQPNSNILKEQPKMDIEKVNMGELKLPENDRQKIISLLNNSNSGITINEISDKLNFDQEKAESVLSSLIKEGEIYQNKPGHFKSI